MHATGPPLPPQIETPRLQLRRWRTDDAPARRAALDASDAHLRPWIPFMQREPRSLDETTDVIQGYIDDFEQGLHARYALWTKEGERLVGGAMMLHLVGPTDREVGYWLHADHCGRGYATEAVGALIDRAFAARVAEVLWFRCDRRNADSIRLAKRLGAVPDGVEVIEAQGVTLQRLRLDRGRFGASART